MRHHHLTATLGGLLIVSLLTGCSPRNRTSTAVGPGTTAGADEKLVIAVIPKGTMHVFWKSVEAGAKEGGRQQGVKIIWKGPLREDDREDQIKVVDDMITRNVDAIVLAPLDDTALVRPVREATRLGIPVVIIDSDLKGDDYVSFVATDNYQGGQIAAKEMGRILGGKGKVIVLRYSEGSGSTMNRERGFLDAIEKFPQIEVVSSNQYAGATAESAYQASENLLSRFRAADGQLSVDGIFASNESGAFGMLRALQDGGFAGKVKYVGFDASDKLNEGLKSGHIHALVVQNPVKMGRLGVEAAIKYIHGQEVEKRIDTGVILATKENMNQPDIHKLLYPDTD